MGHYFRLLGIRAQKGRRNVLRIMKSKIPSKLRKGRKLPLQSVFKLAYRAQDIYERNIQQETPIKDARRMSNIAKGQTKSASTNGKRGSETVRRQVLTGKAASVKQKSPVKLCSIIRHLCSKGKHCRWCLKKDLPETRYTLTAWPYSMTPHLQQRLSEYG